MNPILLEGQVHGGIVQGIGQALYEHTVYDADGQLLTASFLDYAMPRADGVPSFHFETRNVPSITNAFGIKGAGEAGSIGSCPAVMNAIVDALNRAYGIGTSTCRRRRSACGRRSRRAVGRRRPEARRPAGPPRSRLLHEAVPTGSTFRVAGGSGWIGASLR